jgi:hypothetical protein
MRIRGKHFNFNDLWIWIYERCTWDKPDELFYLFWFLSLELINREANFPVAFYKFNQSVED